MLRMSFAPEDFAEAINAIACADMEHLTRMSGHIGSLELCHLPTCITRLVL